jgi:Tfp pilus assembly protein PilP
MVVIASGALWAQSAQPSAPAASSATPAQTAASKSAATGTTAKKTTTATTKTTRKKSSKSTTTTGAPSANVAKNVTTASKTKHAGVPTKRDPFVSPVQSRSNTPLNCGTGKRCLVLDQTRLEGIVKAPNGMIAVVANTANKAYFLRENDPVYNGFVMRITPDSVVFRETMTDRLGKKSTREVVKRVNAPAV